MDAAAEEVIKTPNFPHWQDALWVVAIALLSALVSEALSYYLIYRKEEYQRLRAYIKRLGRMYEKRQRELKAEGGGGGGAAASGKKTDKKLEKLEKDLRMGQKDMTMMTMKTSLLLGVVSSAVYFTVSGRWYGHVVAKLPFWPWKIVQSLSHRGIPGEDSTDGSFTFLYVLANMGIRPSIQKAMGASPPRALESLPNPLLKEEDQ